MRDTFGIECCFHQPRRAASILADVDFAHVHHHGEDAFGYSPSAPTNRSTIAMTNLLLHMQQKFVVRHARPAPVFWGLNVRSCRPASRNTSTRRRSLRTATIACCPR